MVRRKAQQAESQLAREADRALDIEPVGQLTTKRRVAAGARSELFLTAMIEKFPEFDGSWAQEIQSQWWKGYWTLLDLAKMEDL
jgi:hypothetical protein